MFQGAKIMFQGDWIRAKQLDMRQHLQTKFLESDF